MASRKALLIGSGAFLLIALGSGWRSFQSARQDEASLIALKQKLSQLGKSVDQMREQIAAQRREAAALRSRLHGQAPKVAPPAKRPPPIKDPAVLIASDPKVRALYLKSFRANLAPRYEAMYQRLGLTPDQIDKFETLATARADDVVTLKAAALARGLELTDPGVIALEKQNDDQFHATVANELGPVAAQQVTQLDRQQAIQTIVGNLNTMVAFGSPSLTSAQGDQLAQILANASSSYQGGGNADESTIDWNAVYDQAGAILSAPQFFALKVEAADLRLPRLFKQFYAQP